MIKIMLVLNALFFVFSASASDVSGKRYRCVDDSSYEDLDETLSQLPGITEMDLVYNDYPAPIILIPTTNSGSIRDISISGPFSFQNRGVVVDNNGTIFSINVEDTYFGGNFEDVLKVVVNNESEQQESVYTFLCEPYK